MINYGEFLPGYDLIKIEKSDLGYHDTYRDKYWITPQEVFTDRNLVCCLGFTLVEDSNKYIIDLGLHLDNNELFYNHPKDGYQLIQAALQVEPKLLEEFVIAEWLIDRAARLVKLQILK